MQSYVTRHRVAPQILRHIARRSTTHHRLDGGGRVIVSATHTARQRSRDQIPVLFAFLRSPVAVGVFCSVRGRDLSERFKTTLEDCPRDPRPLVMLRLPVILLRGEAYVMYSSKAIDKQQFNLYLICELSVAYCIDRVSIPWSILFAKSFHDSGGEDGSGGASQRIRRRSRLRLHLRPSGGHQGHIDISCPATREAGR